MQVHKRVGFNNCGSTWFVSFPKKKDLALIKVRALKRIVANMQLKVYAITCTCITELLKVVFSYVSTFCGFQTQNSMHILKY